MNKLLGVICSVMFSAGLLQASEGVVKVEKIWTCKEDRNIWNYRIKISKLVKYNENAVPEVVGHQATLSEYNVFTGRERILRPAIKVSEVERVNPAPGAPMEWKGDGFNLTIMITVVDGIDGFYSEFEGLSHRGNPLHLRMGCE
jgi:hypothetical protein